MVIVKRSSQGLRKVLIKWCRCPNYDVGGLGRRGKGVIKKRRDKKKVWVGGKEGGERKKATWRWRGRRRGGGGGIVVFVENAVVKGLVKSSLDQHRQLNWELKNTSEGAGTKDFETPSDPNPIKYILSAFVPFCRDWVPKINILTGSRPFISPLFQLYNSLVKICK